MNHSSRLYFLIFLLLLLLGLSLPAGAQTGCNTGVTLATQAEVDAFSFTGVFDGSIEIGGDIFTATDINNLDALSGLTGITNALVIVNNPLLTDISGLGNLTFLGQSPCQSQRLTIWENPQLADLSAFSGVTISSASRGIALASLPLVTSLSSLSGITGARSVAISSLDGLTNLDGLDNLAAVSFLEVSSCAQLTDIDGLAAVTESWNPRFEGITVDIKDNPVLANLNGLMGMTSASTIRIDNCDALVDLTGMGNLLSIAGGLGIANNAGLLTLNGLNPDLGIGTRVDINNNPQLSVCDYDPICNQIAEGGQFGQITISGNAAGCADVAQVTDACAFVCADGLTETLTSQAEVDAFATAYGNCNNFLGEIIVQEPLSRGVSVTSITNLNALSNLRQVGVLRIHNAPALTNLSGLALLDSINGDLDIRNTAIVNLSDLSNLKKIGGRLDIANNPVLESISSFSNVNRIVNNTVIRFNPLLTDLSGFNNLVTVGDVLEIIGNASLPDLTGFSSLRFAYDGLTINDNDMLTSLTGLEALDNINASLRILNNDQLTDISTLSNLDQATVIAASSGAPGSAALVITDNPILSNCAINTTCNLIAGSGTSIFISGNNTGCESQTVVQTACAVLPIDLTFFKAHNSAKSIHLSWQTTAEENTDKYTCERSVDGGRTFEAIGSVAARNSAAGAAYQYIDEEAASLRTRQLYYRLRAQDFDGSSQVFGPVAVELSLATTNELKIYPNPIAAGRTITVLGAAFGEGVYAEHRRGTGAKLELSAMDGRLLATLKPSGEGATYALPELPAGVYLVRARNGRGFVQTGRFVVR